MFRLRFAVFFLLAVPGICRLADAQSAPPSETPAESHVTLQTTVRRVVLDIVVTDSKGAPVPNLSRSDFSVDEDSQQQNVLSFDVHGFSNAMDYTPSKLPAQPANTFINLPTTPETGPLYVLLFDLANMDNQAQQTSPEDHSAQMVGRQQLVKFIQSKPEGTRFAIFVHSDGLYLVQGFTSDRKLLFTALDPAHPLPHVPRVFLMGPNFGQGDRSTAVGLLREMASYLAEMPGRKNLIWFASNFPLSLTINDTLDGPRFQQELKSVLNLLAQGEIAVYPVDARGVMAGDSFGTAPGFAGPPTGNSGGSQASGPNSANGSVAHGTSLIRASYDAMDQVANATGGHAFYGSNDVAGLLTEATRTGGNYYTLTYSPTNHDYNGKLRQIAVKLEEKGYTLAYRRSYYALPSPHHPGAEPDDPGEGDLTAGDTPKPLWRPASDALSVNMQHGAPMAHQLVFGVQAHRVGDPQPGTPEEMAELATQPAYFKTRRHSRSPKPLPSEPLQAYALGFRIFSKQFRVGGPPLHLEVAAAAYDAEGLAAQRQCPGRQPRLRRRNRRSALGRVLQRQ